jgi:IclR family transcriptional regulator, pca regulon regulatory protein
VNGDEQGKGEGDSDGRGKGSNEARPARSSREEVRYSRVLERGLLLLACFTGERPELGTSELAQMLGIGRSTAHRFARALVELGYLEHTASRKYRLSLGVLDLGMAAFSAMGLREHAHPYVQELARRSGLTVALGVLDGPEVLVVDEVGAKRKGRKGALRGGGAAGCGTHLPAYCTSLGKVLLAHLPSDWQAELISEMELLGLGPKTISSVRELRAELQDVRAHALGSDDEELLAGTCAIAAPVRDETGEVVAAVSVAAHQGALGLDELVKRNVGALTDTAQRISARLGWSDASI